VKIKDLKTGKYIGSKPVLHICKICNKKFYHLLSQNRKFCSRKCVAKNQSINPEIRKIMEEMVYIKIRGKVLSKEEREIRRIKLGDKLKGKNNPGWKGGINRESLTRKIRHSAIYRLWRDSVYRKANFICQKCYNIGIGIHAHHIKKMSDILDEYKINTFEQAINCSELWDLNNGITLCYYCHNNIHYKTQNFTKGHTVKPLLVKK